MLFFGLDFRKMFDILSLFILERSEGCIINGR